MIDEEKSCDELILELRELREHLRFLESRYRATSFQPPNGTIQESGEGAQRTDVFTNGQELPGLLYENGETTATIDLTSLFKKDVTTSGSYDVRGNIWKTTFGKLLHALPIPAVWLDRSSIMIAMNEACGLLSRDYEKMIGSPFETLFPGENSVKKAKDLVATVLGDRKPRTTESALRINQKMKWARLTFRSIRIMADRFLLVLMEDLTLQKTQMLVNRKQQEALKREIRERLRSEGAVRESEARFRQIYDHAPMMIQTIDREGNLLNVNARWLRDMAYERDQVLGSKVTSLLTEESQRVLSGALSMFWTKGEIGELPLQYVRQDGSIMEVLVDSVVSEDPGWGTIGLWTIRDVTNQKTLEKQLREAQKMEAIATLAGGIAHDFNNLLQIIMDFADLLLRDKNKLARSQEGLRSIRAAARRGADLVNRILTFSRKMPTEPRPINLNHVVERSVKLLSRTIPKMIHIELDLEPFCKPVFADSGQMEQSIINLAINAKDAMPEGGTMTIRTRNITLDEDYCRTYPEVQPGDYMGLYVSDNGYGMAKEVLDRIFEPFFTTKGPGEGTGLGLSIVFGIVKAHGGHISCSSQPGGGATFEIVLPAMEMEVEADVDATGEMLAFGTETVLLVDDEQLIRDMGKEILAQAGYTVLTARRFCRPSAS